MWAAIAARDGKCRRENPQVTGGCIWRTSQPWPFLPSGSAKPERSKKTLSIPTVGPIATTGSPKAQHPTRDFVALPNSTKVCHLFVFCERGLSARRLPVYEIIWIILICILKHHANLDRIMVYSEEEHPLPRFPSRKLCCLVVQAHLSPASREFSASLRMLRKPWLLVSWFGRATVDVGRIFGLVVASFRRSTKHFTGTMFDNSTTSKDDIWIGWMLFQAVFKPNFGVDLHLLALILYLGHSLVHQGITHKESYPWNP